MIIGDIPPCVKEVASVVWRIGCVLQHILSLSIQIAERGGSCEDETNKNYSKLG